MSWPIDLPPCHILTYFKTPLLSVGSVPPYGTPVTPSTNLVPPPANGALPLTIIPPQFPLGLAASSALDKMEVKVIGLANVPSAIIFAPCSIISAGAKPLPSSGKALMVTPG